VASLRIIARVKRVSVDMVKEAFIAKALRESTLKSLDMNDVISLYPLNAYDYRIDGENLDYIVPRESITSLVDDAKINGWAVENTGYPGFGDCISISSREGDLVVACRDPSIGDDSERIVFIDKALLGKLGVEVKLEVSGDLPRLEASMEAPADFIVEGSESLTLYFVLNTANVGVDLIAGAYARLLSRGINRLPTAMDVAEYVISTGEGFSDMRVYVSKEELLGLANRVGILILERGGSVVLNLGGMDILEIPRDSWTSSNILRVAWIDTNAMRINGIEVKLADLGSVDPIECSSIIVEKLKSALPTLGIS